MRSRTSASQACGLTLLRLAVPMSVYIAAARAPPRSEPANSHDFLPKAIPRSALSANLRSACIQPLRSASTGALSSWRTARRCSAALPLIPRSMSNSTSIRFTRLQRERRDRRRVLAASLAGRDVGELEELPPAMRPARCLGDRSRRSSGRIEAVVAGVDVRLEDPGEGSQMLDRVIAGPVPRVAEQCRRRVRTAERRVVADVDPGPRGSGSCPWPAPAPACHRRADAPPPAHAPRIRSCSGRSATVQAPTWSARVDRLRSTPSRA